MKRKFRKTHHFCAIVVDFPRQNDTINMLSSCCPCTCLLYTSVAKMNARVEELGLAHTHFANPHGISGDDHYTSCYDMAQILSLIHISFPWRCSG